MSQIPDADPSAMSADEQEAIIAQLTSEEKADMDAFLAREFEKKQREVEDQEILKTLVFTKTGTDEVIPQEDVPEEVIRHALEQKRALIESEKQEALALYRYIERNTLIAMRSNFTRSGVPHNHLNDQEFKEVLGTVFEEIVNAGVVQHKCGQLAHQMMREHYRNTIVIPNSGIILSDGRING